MDYGGVAEQNGAVYGEEEDEVPQQYDGGHYGAEQGGNYDDGVDNVGGGDTTSAGVKHDDSSSSAAGKLFVGGIAWETSEESFGRYFRKFGEITDSVIMMDKITGRPRGFGFVTFSDPEVAERVLQEDHVIGGRTVEVKRTVPREAAHGRGVTKTQKIFVGGLPLSLHEVDLRDYFSSYGNIVEHQIMLDRETSRSRGFGFVTFDSEDAVEKIFSDGRMHELGGKQVEIKRAEPKRSGFDHSTESRFRRGGSSSRSSGSYASGSEGFGGSYGGKMGRAYSGYGGYGGYGNFPGNYASGAAGFYTGYGGYGYGGYGFGGPMYGGGAAYGGGGFGAPVGYGGAAVGYGVDKGYDAGGYEGGKGFGGRGSGSGGGYGTAKGYGGSGAGGGGYGNGKGYGNGNAPSGRFHPYRK